MRSGRALSGSDPAKDRVKTDRRDAVTQASLFRSGDSRILRKHALHMNRNGACAD